MSGAPRRWIRLDVGCFESEWLVVLHPLAQHAWTRVLLYVKVAGKLGRVKALGPTAVQRLWGVPPAHLRAMLEAANEDGAMRTEDGDWIVTAWERYQEPDRTAVDRKRRQRARGESGTVTEVSRMSHRDAPSTPRDPSRDHRPLTVDPRPDTSKATETPSPTSSADDVTPGTALSVGTNGNGDPALWMHAVWQEELGSRIPLPMNDERRQKYRAMYSENLSGTPDPPTAWRAVLWAVKQSEFHMRVRAYQMPESLLQSASNRSKWVQVALSELSEANGTSQQERDAEKIREHLRRRES